MRREKREKKREKREKTECYSKLETERGKNVLRQTKLTLLVSI